MIYSIHKTDKNAPLTASGVFFLPYRILLVFCKVKKIYIASRFVLRNKG